MNLGAFEVIDPAQELASPESCPPEQLDSWRELKME
jgi:hypothetical protein